LTWACRREPVDLGRVGIWSASSVQHPTGGRVGRRRDRTRETRVRGDLHPDAGGDVLGAVETAGSDRRMPFATGCEYMDARPGEWRAGAEPGGAVRPAGSCWPRQQPCAVVEGHTAGAHARPYSNKKNDGGALMPWTRQTRRCTRACGSCCSRPRNAVPGADAGGRGASYLRPPRIRSGPRGDDRITASPRSRGPWCIGTDPQLGAKRQGLRARLPGAANSVRNLRARRNLTSAGRATTARRCTGRPGGRGRDRGPGPRAPRTGAITCASMSSEAPTRRCN